jgi:hypothetical protein
LDRRYNPRASFYIFKHLQHAIGGSPSHTIQMALIESNVDIRAFSIEVSHYHCVLLLPELEEYPEDLNELQITWTPLLNRQEGMGQRLDLQTGSMRSVHWKRSMLQSDQITLAPPSQEHNPVLLILETSEGLDVPDLTGEL